jgi:hypothetical protein
MQTQLLTSRVVTINIQQNTAYVQSIDAASFVRNISNSEQRGSVPATIETIQYPSSW